MINLDPYKQEDLTIDAGKAQLSALLYIIPIILVFGLPYYILWQSTLTIENHKTILTEYSQWLSVAIFSSMIVGIILHELIHGLTWSLFATNGLKSMTYGIIWKWLTPYCHCKEPLLVKHYITGALMPGIILGIVPSILALITGSLALILFGLLFTIVASGDFMIVTMLIKESMNSLVQDHPSRVGCYIYRPLK